MKPSSKLAIFALQQKSSRPGATIVLTVFTLVYFLYLLTLLIINVQAGWFAQLETQYEYSTFTELYNFEYYFRSYSYNDYNISIQTTTTTQFLVRSEIMFIASLTAMVIVLAMAHYKATNGSDTIKRLSISHRSVKVMQWLSDCVYIFTIWLSHLVVIFAFYIVYLSLAPDELIYPNNLFLLFAKERYLYLLFPVLNPLSLIRMLSLILAISFLPSLISGIIDSILEKDFEFGMLVLPIILIGIISWSFLSSGHIASLILCAIAAFAGVFCFGVHLFGGGTANAK